MSVRTFLPECPLQCPLHLSPQVDVWSTLQIRSLPWLSMTLCLLLVFGMEHDRREGLWTLTDYFNRLSDCWIVIFAYRKWAFLDDCSLCLERMPIVTFSSRMFMFIFGSFSYFLPVSLLSSPRPGSKIIFVTNRPNIFIQSLRNSVFRSLSNIFFRTYFFIQNLMKLI